MATTNPWLVVPICLVLHYIVDAVPHAEWQPWRRTSSTTKLLMVTDAAATVLLVWLMYTAYPLIPGIVSLAVLAGILPDLADRFTRTHLPKLRYVHVLLHTWPQKPVEPIDWGKTITGRTPNLIKVLTQSVLILLGLLPLVT